MHERKVALIKLDDMVGGNLAPTFEWMNCRDGVQSVKKARGQKLQLGI